MSGVAEVSSTYLAKMDSNTIPFGYKQTEVGVIPKDWVIEKLGSIGKFKNGINKSADDFGFGHPFVNLMDVFGKPEIRGNESFGLINSTEIDKKEYSLVEGDVLFIRSSVKPSGVGLTTVVMSDLKETVYSGFLIRFRTDKQLVTEFKKHCFYEESFRVRVISNSTVSANTNINQDALKDIYFVFPSSKKEQTAIANALSDVDALISELEKLIAKKQAIKTATMQKLLTGRTRLPQFALRDDGTPTNSSGTPLLIEKGDAGTGGPKGEGHDGLRKSTKPSELGEIPEDWEVVELGKLLAYEQPTNYLISHTKFLDEGLYPVLTAGKSFILGYTNEEHGVFTNLPVIIFDDFTTDSKFVDFPFKAKSSAMKMLKPINKNTPLSLIYNLLNSVDYLVGDHKRHWIGEFQFLNVAIPSKENEQIAIATILSDMDAEVQALEQRLGKTRQIKQGMMQELLTGKTRLIKGEAHG